MKLSKYIAIFIFVFSGCAEKHKVDKEIKLDEVPKYQLAKKSQKTTSNKGSLFSSHSNSLFSDRKALQIGDIVKVNFQESLNGSMNDTIGTTSKNASSSSGGLISGNSNTPAKLNTAIGNANGILGIGFKSGSDSKRVGTSNGSTSNSLNGSIAAIIQERYQNGNYFILGQKIMSINGQQMTVKVSGIIRPYDISTNDTISSQAVANLKIVYDKKGAYTNGIEESWGTKVLNAISPF